MKLTICLVTKGREQYLDQILSSFEPLLNDDAIEFLIIDNGTPVGIRERLNHWGYLNPNCVKIIRLETNDSRPSTFWNKVVEEGADWTVFPSDDDEFRPEIIAAWRSAIHRNSELVGFAASAEVMNANGSLTGEKLEPSARRFQSTLDQLASALHEPPFLWPSLFIRVSKLPIVVPNSRYAFDWWIGINLLIAGEVETTDMVGINYRVHVEQESFLAPLRRKYFEAEFWVDDFLRGEEFLTWITKLSDYERLILWKRVIANRPIYGDPYFSRVVMASLARAILKSAHSHSLKLEVMTINARAQGVFLKDGESKNLIFERPDISSPCSGNLNIEFEASACDALRLTSNFLVGGPSAERIQIFCRHSSSKKDAIFIDCSKFKGRTPDINADIVVNLVTEHLEAHGDLELTVSSGERLLIRLLRSWKKHLPSPLQTALRKTKGRKLSA